jgi:hypothetical protein
MNATTGDATSTTAEKKKIRRACLAIVDFGRRQATIGCPLPWRHDREQTMNYLCLVYYDEKTLDELSKNEYDALDSEALAYEPNNRVRSI